MLIESNDILSRINTKPYYKELQVIINEIILNNVDKYNCELTRDYEKVVTMMCNEYETETNACRKGKKTCPLLDKDCFEINDENIEIAKKWIHKKQYEN